MNYISGQKLKRSKRVKNYMKEVKGAGFGSCLEARVKEEGRLLVLERDSGTL